MSKEEKQKKKENTEITTEDLKKELQSKDGYDFEDLVRIMSILRGDGGCPWDREQTHESIRKNFIEEAYEVVEAIDEKNNEHICEELGDTLLQVVFHSRMAQEEGAFDIDDVTTGICKKLIYRHPHIFADSKKGSSEEVLEAWEELKRKEKGRLTLGDDLESVCKTLPALQKCQKVIKKTSSRGIKVNIEDLNEIPLSDDERSVAIELFNLCDRASSRGINAEEVLQKLCNGYITKITKGE